MKKQLLTFLLITIFFYSHAQTTFQKTFGGTSNETGYAVQPTSDGGYIITGYTVSYGAGGEDVYLIKTDFKGDTLWTKTFGRTGDDNGRAVQQTTDGGYIITGYSYSFVSFSYDIYLIKTDAAGNSQWIKTFGGSGNDVSYSVQQTTDGGYIVVGWTSSFGAGLNDIYLLKIDSNGNLLWTKVFGGASDDDGFSVQQTTDGGYIVTGWTRSFGAGLNDIYLAKTDSIGNLAWTKTFGGTGIDFGYSVRQTSDNGYIIAGDTKSFGVDSSDVYLIKTDSTGGMLWTKTMGGANFDIGRSVLQTNDGGYIISGVTYYSTTNSDIYLIKTDSNGNSVWVKTFGGTGYDEGWSVQQAADGGYILGNHSRSFGAGQADICLIKTDSSGNSGCNERDTTTLVTSPPTQVSGPFAIITPVVTSVTTAPTTVFGNGGMINPLCITIGIPSSSFNSGVNDILIAPNPSRGNFIILFQPEMKKGNVEIVNQYGETIFFENIFNESKKEIHLEKSSPGIYFVKMFDGKKYYCRKVVVE